MGIGLEQGCRIVHRALRGRSDLSACVVLGSGWGTVLQELNARPLLSYRAIPCLGSTTVQGHGGWIHLVGRPRQRNILILEGRRHWYEGDGWDPVVFPAHLCASLGIPILVLTNAAGSLRRAWYPGTFMALRDHINAMGTNPLIGPVRPLWGSRFPDQSAVYDPRLREALVEAARRNRISLHQGTYLAVSGPSYETPAEIRAMQRMGADAVGMSTVPEAMVAHAAGVRVAAVSCLANWATGIAGSRPEHSEVTAVMAQASRRAGRLLSAFLEALAP